MNIWIELSGKIGEKILINQVKQSIWNNPNTSTKQKNTASNVIDVLSLSKDIYDIVRIANEINILNNKGMQKTNND